MLAVCKVNLGLYSKCHIFASKKTNSVMCSIYENLLSCFLFQLCVIFSEELKCWCRAVVKSIMYCADHYQIECFLVDYAKYTFVKSKE